MPTYTYCCDKCNYKFELFSSIANYIEHPICEKCNTICSRSYYDDLNSSVTSVIKSDSELSTIGDLANRNRDRMTEDHKKELHHKHNSYKDEFCMPLPKNMNRLKGNKNG
jgi:hypothetical protein